MSHIVPTQHAGPVLRFTFQRVRALLAIAMIAVVGLTIAVVVLAVNNGTNASAGARASRHAISSGPVVQPNRDEQGLTASALGSNSSYFYPGRY